RRGIRLLMLSVLAVLLLLLTAPFVAYRISLSWHEGKLEAEAKVARLQLKDINLVEFGRASRLVAKAVGPSVVSINTIQSAGQEKFADERQFYSGPQQQSGRELTGQGSGVIVDKEGYILTNWHVIAGATQINVHLNGDAPHRATLIGLDAEMDLALLQVNQKDLTPIPWGSSSEIEVGDPVWAVGSPFGLENTVTFGIISGKGRRNVGGDSAKVFLQTNASINPGNSGGPLVNIRGELVGINTAILAAPNSGIGFAIPSDTARKVYERLKNDRPERPPANGYLGVRFRPLTPELVESLSLKPEQDGGLVARVGTGSPAEEAGLRAGDLIVGFNGKDAGDPTRLSLLIAASQPGTKVDLSVIRGGEPLTVPVTIGKRPK
ncbi:MAG: trypsin-like peptidase domain-containing protein, partial [Planctomycetes bacterium]|nr:trypsin-like peptidase domain-containing protein [Planctomycetota bacterium]